MTLIPHRFLFRVAYPCRHVKAMPGRDALLDLPDECRIDNFAAMDGQRNFAEVALAWNELGEQLLSITPEFPFWEDPSLWGVLELVR
jgi:hypothetical protein